MLMADACPYQHVNVCDLHARRGLPGGMARLGRSEVCNGQGVFATCFLPTGTPVTGYACVKVAPDVTRDRLRPRPPVDSDYMYTRTDGREIDGHPTILRGRYSRRSWGYANMANDALHLELTQRENNCKFVERSDAVYLVTIQSVEAGDELLVSYGFDYWWFRRNDLRLPLHVRKWLKNDSSRSAYEESADSAGRLRVSS